MQFAAICDACRTALTQRVTSIQVMQGTMITSPSGPTLRSTGSPEVHFLCPSCAAPVINTVHALVRGAPTTE